MTIQDIIEKLEAMQDYAIACGVQFDSALVNYESEIEKLIEELNDALVNYDNEVGKLILELMEGD